MQDNDSLMKSQIIKEVGLWVDHHKTVIVFLLNNRVMTKEINSSLGDEGLELGVKRTSPSIDTFGTMVEDKWNQEFGNSLGWYYDEVIAHIRDAESIWIFGPGEAKIELENQLRRADLGARVVGIETTGNLTNSQLIKKVRGRYCGK